MYGQNINLDNYGAEFQTGTTSTQNNQQINYQFDIPTTTNTTTTTTSNFDQYFNSPTNYTQSEYTTSGTSQTYNYTQSQQTQQDYGFNLNVQQPTGYNLNVQQPSYTTGIPGFNTAPKPKPVVKLLRQGSGISPNEQQGIVSTAMMVYQNQITPLSNNTASRIKKLLKGDWLVIVYPQGKPIDFNMTCVQGNDYMYFTLDNTAYQVCRLR